MHALSGLGMLAAPKAHGEGLVPKNFTQIVAPSSYVYSWTFWPSKF